MAAFKCSNIHGTSFALMLPSSTLSNIWAFLKLIWMLLCVYAHVCVYILTENKGERQNSCFTLSMAPEKA